MVRKLGITYHSELLGYLRQCSENFLEYIILPNIDYFYYKMATSDDLDDFVDFSIKLLIIGLQLRNTLFNFANTAHNYACNSFSGIFFRTFPKKAREVVMLRLRL